MFLLVPAHPGRPGQRAVNRSCGVCTGFVDDVTFSRNGPYGVFQHRGGVRCLWMPCVRLQGVLSIPCKSLFNPTHHCKAPAVVTFRVRTSHHAPVFFFTLSTLLVQQYSLTFRIRRICCHSNETCAPIANPPSIHCTFRSAQCLV